MATIYDIAKKAGVSTATVSRALRGRSEVVVEVRERVIEAARELGYRPNRLAQALTAGKTNMFGLVMPEPDGNPYYSDLMEAISRCCRQYGYEAVIQLSDLKTDDSITNAATYLEEHQVDGLLLFAAPMHLEHYAATRTHDSPPWVSIGSPLDFLGPTVRADEHFGGAEVTRHLIALGHKQIAFMGPGASSSKGSRQVGYADAMQEAGLPTIFRGSDASVEDARECTMKLLADDDRPTAIVGFSDHTALGVLRACHEAGVTVPDELSVTGFDNLEFARYSNPALTTVDPQTERIACESVEYLIGRIDGSIEADAVEPLTIQPVLVERESTAPPPGGAC